MNLIHNYYFVIVCMLLSCSLFFLCNRNEKYSFSPKVVSLKGTVMVIGNRKKEQVKRGYNLQSGNVVRIGKNSTATIRVNEKILYCNEKTEIEYIRVKTNRTFHLTLNLIEGEVFTVIDAPISGDITVVLKTPNVSVQSKATRYSLTHFKSSGITRIKNLQKDMTVYPLQKDSIRLKGCTKMLCTSEGRMSHIIPVRKKDMDGLKKWLTGEQEQEALNHVSCVNPEKLMNTVKPPPRETNNEKTTRSLVSPVDSRSSLDPVLSIHRNTPKRDPVGIRESKNNGIIQETPVKPIDKHATYPFFITQKPLYGSVKTEFLLSVEYRMKENVIPSEYALRWDLNNDGRWDYPRDQSFTNTMSFPHKWNKTGSYIVHAEIMLNENKKKVIAKTITVFNGVSIKRILGPDTAHVNETIVCTCIAVDPDFTIQSYNWDFAETGVSKKKTKNQFIEFFYREKGKHTLICSVKNEKGMVDSESKYIYVTDDTLIIDAGGPYTAFVNKAVTVKGYCNAFDSTRDSFQWDFNNDGIFEWHSKKKSKAVHTFTQKGTYTLWFRVETDEGVLAEDSAIVLVNNRPPLALAGEDIVSKKNRKVSLKGMGKDPDENIVKYDWDFDGDGVFDWTSKNNGFVEKKFAGYGKAIFRVTDSEDEYDIDTLTIVMCPKDMETITEGKFCMDIYEWPNIKNEYPQVNISFEESIKMCRKVGKRLCTYSEIKLACQGKENKHTYPYGKKFTADNCNTLGNRHTDNALSKSGEFIHCISQYGIYDMSGNVMEWTSTKQGELVLTTGGWWQDGEKRTRCESYLSLEKIKKYPYVGFRCCK